MVRQPFHLIFPEHVTEANVNRNRPTPPPTLDSAQTNKVLTSRDLQPVKVDVIVGSESPSGWSFRIGPVKPSASKISESWQERINFLWSRYKRGCRSGQAGNEYKPGKVPALRHAEAGSSPKFLDAPDLIGAERSTTDFRRVVGF